MFVVRLVPMTTHPFLRRTKLPLREVDRIGKVEPSSCLAVLRHVIPLLAEEPCPPCEGTGVVMVAGGRYLREAWASVNKLREVSDLPVQIWHLGQGEVTERDRMNFEDLEVEFVNAYDFLDEHPSYQFGGWQAKSYATAYCPFRHVLQLDADCHPLADPMELFQSEEYKATGSIHWPDLNKCRQGDMIFPCTGIKRPKDFQEIEVGQVVYDKERLWKALRLTVWMNSHSECFYKLQYGDTLLYVLALMKLGYQFTIAEKATWHGWGMTHYWKGNPVFRHAMNLKRSTEKPPEDLAELFREYDQLIQPIHATNS